MTIYLDSHFQSSFFHGLRETALNRKFCVRFSRTRVFNLLIFCRMVFQYNLYRAKNY
jgi:hypothetical protein